jgi:ABC-2 type transport system ATP-binding protein
LVNGFDTVKDEVKVRSLIGLATAEERSFYWRLSCEQNMLFFARLYGMNDRESNLRILQLFEQLRLTELSKRKFSDLSTGNKQRLAVARALLANPPCLLLDEPTRSLDPIAAANMRELIASLKNVSILLTSHNLTEIEELCSRVAIISKGEIKAVGQTEELRRQHKQTQQVTITYNLKNTLQSQIFSREVDDDLLGKIISELTNKGAKIIDVETQKATLLDVLESYEK